jgi:urea carboxylase-associated protein 2
MMRNDYLTPEPLLANDERFTLTGGGMWSRRMQRGQVLRLIDPSGKAAVAALFYNADDPLERYNMPDTLKAQYTAFLTRGRVLYSDMGRILASIVNDTCGWHDTISGCGNAATTLARYGEGTYQERRNEFYRNTRDNFLIELGKHGLGKRDIVPNLNFFVRVSVDESGRMSWVNGNSRPGAYVDLRFEMSTLVVLSNTPHPMDPATTYAPPAVALALTEGPPAMANDPCRLSRPENARGFALTERYLRQWMS